MDIKNNSNIAEVIIKKSDKPEKKFVAIINNDKKVYFGAAGYSDYLQHNDDKRKERYIKRHEKIENWNNPTTAGFWSRWLLWNKEMIAESLADINKRFNLNVELKLK
jgi:hypothetical protein